MMIMRPPQQGQSRGRTLVSSGGVVSAAAIIFNEAKYQTFQLNPGDEKNRYPRHVHDGATFVIQSEIREPYPRFPGQAYGLRNSTGTSSGDE